MKQPSEREHDFEDLIQQNIGRCQLQRRMMLPDSLCDIKYLLCFPAEVTVLAEPPEPLPCLHVAHQGHAEVHANLSAQPGRTTNPTDQRSHLAHLQNQIPVDNVFCLRAAGIVMTLSDGAQAHLESCSKAKSHAVKLRSLQPKYRRFSLRTQMRATTWNGGTAQQKDIRSCLLHEVGIAEKQIGSKMQGVLGRFAMKSSLASFPMRPQPSGDTLGRCFQHEGCVAPQTTRLGYRTVGKREQRCFGSYASRV